MIFILHILGKTKALVENLRVLFTTLYLFAPLSTYHGET